MLTKVQIARYKSLFKVDVDLEPLTILIGPNGSGKSNFCEGLTIFNQVYNLDTDKSRTWMRVEIDHRQEDESLFWKGIKKDIITLTAQGHVSKVENYNFIPIEMTKQIGHDMSPSGLGIVNSLTKVLFDDRDKFIELENRFVKLVPNIKRIKLDQDANGNKLFLTDNSDYEIPSKNISDGTLRILAFLAALYDTRKPDLICFEEPENGIHPWLLNKIIELMKQASTEGITGKPTQIIITTHSPVLLNYVEPKQIRAVELDEKGATQIRSIPTESKRFQKALEAYDGELGELWFTNIFGANPV